MSRFPFKKPDFSLASVFGRAAADNDKKHVELRSSLNRASKPAKPTIKATRPAPVSVRLTLEEREQLTQEAAGMSLSAFIRDRLFGDRVAPRKTRGKFPVEDHKALARALATLGRSDHAATLKRALRLAESGRASLRPETEEQLRKACADIEAMKADLVKALGLKAERQA